jgi:hypothetical protein
MRQRSRISLLIFLILALCSWNGAKAQASDEIPKKIQRNWAQPDCGDVEEAVVLSRYFYLRSTETDLTLLPAGLDGKRQDYWLMDFGGAATPARLENDGILKIGTPAKPGAGWPKTWDQLPLDDTQEYTGCEAAPKVVPKVLQRLMRYIDRIKEQCTMSVTNECAGVLFKLADENGDRKISEAEIRRTALSAILFAELAQRKNLSSAEAMKIVADSRMAALQIADAVLAAHGKTRSQSLDYNELMGDFKPPELPIVKQTLEKAGVLLPSFKVVAMTLK